MLLNRQHCGRLLRDFRLSDLFIEEMGWDHHAQTLDVGVGGRTFSLSAIAHKRGFVVFQCAAPGGAVPDYATRRKIETQVAKSVREHLIIHADADKSTQVWQWVKREPDKPSQCRDHIYTTAQSGEALIQKLEFLAFSLEEEERLSIVDVSSRIQLGLYAERVTKRFYDRFKSQHAVFLRFVKGIPDGNMKAWYVSVTLNRLMFIYFLQKKGFLDADVDYLRHKLEECKRRGRDHFYRDFLSTLFFEGFAKTESDRSPAVNRLLGRVPYLNGGIFMRHQIEELHGQTIQITDAAFERLFAFFSAYRWHLDERPLRTDNEINPDVLGYIFEKYINQKEMGAYYTKEDITQHIGKNTILPFLFDAVQTKCERMFEVGSSVWQLLREDPDRYIYESMQYGVLDHGLEVIAESYLPTFVRKDMHDPKGRVTDTRYNLDQSDLLAADGLRLTLPTETWREYVARRNRCLDLRQRMVNGLICSIADCVTHNLDLRQFAQDVIENTDSPDLIVAFWDAIRKLTVLDPTCGSGAFLFAALNIIEPLYEACLERMRRFLEEWAEAGKKTHSSYSSIFAQVLADLEKHPSARYFVLKSIIVNNLYGVDILEEAVEICKLRLFLKLVAQIERVEDLEPLPDIDFNIRAGNTLVGFVSLEDIRKAIPPVGFEEDKARIALVEKEAVAADTAFCEFHEMQTVENIPVTSLVLAKERLRALLRRLTDELDRFLAGEYGVKKKDVLETWSRSHQPFHWFAEFYGILKAGGVDVIIGNPPYVEYSTVKKKYTILGYETESCGNLYAYVIERCFDILRDGGYLGMIVQLPIVCTDRMKPLQKECLKQNSHIWFANFDDRPARLFGGLEHIRASVFTARKNRSKANHIYSTSYNRWYSEARPQLFESLSFEEISAFLMDGAIPKIGHPVSRSIMRRISEFKPVASFLSSSAGSAAVFYHNAPQYWIRAMNFAPYFWNKRDGEQISGHVKTLKLPTKFEAALLVSALNSSVFYWWFILLSNCRDLIRREIERFPLGLDRMPKEMKTHLAELSDLLMADLKKHKRRKECEYVATGRVVYDEFYPKHSKPIIDKIDGILARHYGFTDEELDFIINYDIKYRMGRDDTESGDVQDSQALGIGGR